MSVADLFAELASAPRLDGALCRGHGETFDEPGPDEDQDDVSARIAFAISACRCCPALGACCAWIDTLPLEQRPRGVTGGRINGRSSPR